ncbi:MAG: PIN domain-containing protein [Gaiellaceae bacterium]
MTVLADTSIWIDFYRGREPNAEGLARLIRQQDVIICGPVVAELIAEAPEDRREELDEALGALPFIPLGDGEWREAGVRAYELRRRGGAVPLLDILIAVAATRAAAALWTRDEHFARIGQVLPSFALYGDPVE